MYDMCSVYMYCFLLIDIDYVNGHHCLYFSASNIIITAIVSVTPNTKLKGKLLYLSRQGIRFI